MHETRGCFRIGMAFSLGLAALAIGACEEDDPREGGTPVSTNALCCDCTCTDGLEPCAHFIVEDREATNCEAVCTDTCATVDECAGVDTSETCGGTPPPTGFNDLLCNAMCNRIYDQCNLTLADEDGLPIPTDQCDRFCQNEVIPIPALSCLSQIPCQEVYMLECLDIRADEQLPKDD